MWLALLLLSWFVEGVVGVWFCYHYWMFTQIHYEGGATFMGPGYAIVQGSNAFMPTCCERRRRHRMRRPSNDPGCGGCVTRTRACRCDGSDACW
jgi:hypothetical protein